MSTPRGQPVVCHLSQAFRDLSQGSANVSYIVYENGDIYQGEVSESNVPHGKGYLWIARPEYTHESTSSPQDITACHQLWRHTLHEGWFCSVFTGLFHHGEQHIGEMIWTIPSTELDDTSTTLPKNSKYIVYTGSFSQIAYKDEIDISLPDGWGRVQIASDLATHCDSSLVYPKVFDEGRSSPVSTPGFHVVDITKLIIDTVNDLFDFSIIDNSTSPSFGDDSTLFGDISRESGSEHRQHPSKLFIRKQLEVGDNSDTTNTSVITTPRYWSDMYSKYLKPSSFNTYDTTVTQLSLGKIRVNIFAMLCPFLLGHVPLQWTQSLALEKLTDALPFCFEPISVNKSSSGLSLSSPMSTMSQDLSSQPTLTPSPQSSTRADAVPLPLSPSSSSSLSSPTQLPSSPSSPSNVSHSPRSPASPQSRRPLVDAMGSPAAARGAASSSSAPVSLPVSFLQSLGGRQDVTFFEGWFSCGVMIYGFECYSSRDLLYTSYIGAFSHGAWEGRGTLSFNGISPLFSLNSIMSSINVHNGKLNPTDSHPSDSSRLPLVQSFGRALLHAGFGLTASCTDVSMVTQQYAIIEALLQLGWLEYTPDELEEVLSGLQTKYEAEVTKDANVTTGELGASIDSFLQFALRECGDDAALKHLQQQQQSLSALWGLDIIKYGRPLRLHGLFTRGEPSSASSSFALDTISVTQVASCLPIDLTSSLAPSSALSRDTPVPTTISTHDAEQLFHSPRSTDISHMAHSTAICIVRYTGHPESSPSSPSSPSSLSDDKHPTYAIATIRLSPLRDSMVDSLHKVTGLLSSESIRYAIHPLQFTFTSRVVEELYEPIAPRSTIVYGSNAPMVAISYRGSTLITRLADHTSITAGTMVTPTYVLSTALFSDSYGGPTSRFEGLQDLYIPSIGKRFVGCWAPHHVSPLLTASQSVMSSSYYGDNDTTMPLSPQQRSSSHAYTAQKTSFVPQHPGEFEGTIILTAPHPLAGSTFTGVLDENLNLQRGTIEFTSNRAIQDLFTIGLHLPDLLSSLFTTASQSPTSPSLSSPSNRSTSQSGTPPMVFETHQQHHLLQLLINGLSTPSSSADTLLDSLSTHSPQLGALLRQWCDPKAVTSAASPAQCGTAPPLAQFLSLLLVQPSQWPLHRVLLSSFSGTFKDDLPSSGSITMVDGGVWECSTIAWNSSVAAHDIDNNSNTMSIPLYFIGQATYTAGPRVQAWATVQQEVSTASQRVHHQLQDQYNLHQSSVISLGQSANHTASFLASSSSSLGVSPSSLLHSSPSTLSSSAVYGAGVGLGLGHGLDGAATPPHVPLLSSTWTANWGGVELLHVEPPSTLSSTSSSTSSPHGVTASSGSTAQSTRASPGYIMLSRQPSCDTVHSLDMVIPRHDRRILQTLLYPSLHVEDSYTTDAQLSDLYMALYTTKRKLHRVVQDESNTDNGVAPYSVALLVNYDWLGSLPIPTISSTTDAYSSVSLLFALYSDILFILSSVAQKYQSAPTTVPPSQDGSEVGTADGTSTQVRDAQHHSVTTMTTYVVSPDSPFHPLHPAFELESNTVVQFVPHTHKSSSSAASSTTGNDVAIDVGADKTGPRTAHEQSPVTQPRPSRRLSAYAQYSSGADYTGFYTPQQLQFSLDDKSHQVLHIITSIDIRSSRSTTPRNDNDNDNENDDDRDHSEAQPTFHKSIVSYPGKWVCTGAFFAPDMKCGVRVAIVSADKYPCGSIPSSLCHSSSPISLLHATRHYQSRFILDTSYSGVLRAEYADNHPVCGTISANTTHTLPLHTVLRYIRDHALLHSSLPSQSSSTQIYQLLMRDNLPASPFNRAIDWSLLYLERRMASNNSSSDGDDGNDHDAITIKDYMISPTLADQLYARAFSVNHHKVPHRKPPTTTTTATTTTSTNATSTKVQPHASVPPPSTHITLAEQPFLYQNIHPSTYDGPLSCLLTPATVFGALKPSSPSSEDQDGHNGVTSQPPLSSSTCVLEYYNTHPTRTTTPTLVGTMLVSFPDTHERYCHHLFTKVTTTSALMRGMLLGWSHIDLQNGTTFTGLYTNIPIMVASRDEHAQRIATAASNAPVLPYGMRPPAVPECTHSGVVTIEDLNRLLQYTIGGSDGLAELTTRLKAVMTTTVFPGGSGGSDIHLRDLPNNTPLHNAFDLLLQCIANSTWLGTSFGHLKGKAFDYIGFVNMSCEPHGVGVYIQHVTPPPPSPSSFHVKSPVQYTTSHVSNALEDAAIGVQPPAMKGSIISHTLRGIEDDMVYTASSAHSLAHGGDDTSHLMGIPSPMLSVLVHDHYGSNDSGSAGDSYTSNQASQSTAAVTTRIDLDTLPEDLHDDDDEEDLINKQQELLLISRGYFCGEFFHNNPWYGTCHYSLDSAIPRNTLPSSSSQQEMPTLYPMVAYQSIFYDVVTHTRCPLGYPLSATFDHIDSITDSRPSSPLLDSMGTVSFYSSNTSCDAQWSFEESFAPVFVSVAQQLLGQFSAAFSSPITASQVSSILAAHHVDPSHETSLLALIGDIGDGHASGDHPTLPSRDAAAQLAQSTMLTNRSSKKIMSLATSLLSEWPLAVENHKFQLPVDLVKQLHLTSTGKVPDTRSISDLIDSFNTLFDSVKQAYLHLQRAKESLSVLDYNDQYFQQRFHEFFESASSSLPSSSSSSHTNNNPNNIDADARGGNDDDDDSEHGECEYNKAIRDVSSEYHAVFDAFKLLWNDFMDAAGYDVAHAMRHQFFAPHDTILSLSSASSSLSPSPSSAAQGSMSNKNSDDDEDNSDNSTNNDLYTIPMHKGQVPPHKSVFSLLSTASSDSILADSFLDFLREYDAIHPTTTNTNTAAGSPSPSSLHNGVSSHALLADVISPPWDTAVIDNLHAYLQSTRLPEIQPSSSLMLFNPLQVEEKLHDALWRSPHYAYVRATYDNMAYFYTHMLSHLRVSVAILIHLCLSLSSYVIGSLIGISHQQRLFYSHLPSQTALMASMSMSPVSNGSISTGDSGWVAPEMEYTQLKAVISPSMDACMNKLFSLMTTEMGGMKNSPSTSPESRNTVANTQTTRQSKVYNPHQLFLVPYAKSMEYILTNEVFKAKQTASLMTMMKDNTTNAGNTTDQQPSSSIDMVHPLNFLFSLTHFRSVAALQTAIIYLAKDNYPTADTSGAVGDMVELDRSQDQTVEPFVLPTLPCDLQQPLSDMVLPWQSSIVEYIPRYTSEVFTDLNTPLIEAANVSRHSHASSLLALFNAYTYFHSTYVFNYLYVFPLVITKTKELEAARVRVLGMIDEYNHLNNQIVHRITVYSGKQRKIRQLQKDYFHTYEIAYYLLHTRPPCVSNDKSGDQQDGNQEGKPEGSRPFHKHNPLLTCDEVESKVIAILQQCDNDDDDAVVGITNLNHVSCEPFGNSTRFHEVITNSRHNPQNKYQTYVHQILQQQPWLAPSLFTNNTNSATTATAATATTTSVGLSSSKPTKHDNAMFPHLIHLCVYYGYYTILYLLLSREHGRLTSTKTSTGSVRYPLASLLSTNHMILSDAHGRISRMQSSSNDSQEKQGEQQRFIRDLTKYIAIHGLFGVGTPYHYAMSRYTLDEERSMFQCFYSAQRAAQQQQQEQQQQRSRSMPTLPTPSMDDLAHAVEQSVIVVEESENSPNLSAEDNKNEEDVVVDGDINTIVLSTTVTNTTTNKSSRFIPSTHYGLCAALLYIYGADPFQPSTNHFTPLLTSTLLDSTHQVLLAKLLCTSARVAVDAVKAALEYTLFGTSAIGTSGRHSTDTSTHTNANSVVDNTTIFTGHGLRSYNITTTFPSTPRHCIPIHEQGKDYLLPSSYQSANGAEYFTLIPSNSESKKYTTQQTQPRSDSSRDMTYTPHNDSPLHIAARTTNTVLAEHLLQLGVSRINALNHHGLSPIHLCSDLPMAQTLASYGANILRKPKGKDYTPAIPLPNGGGYFTVKQLAEHLQSYTQLFAQRPAAVVGRSYPLGIILSPSHPLWQHDDNHSQCMDCSVAFTLLNRKHHCRLCGFVYCKDCLIHRFTVTDHCNTVAPSDSSTAAAAGITTTNTTAAEGNGGGVKKPICNACANRIYYNYTSTQSPATTPPLHGTNRRRTVQQELGQRHRQRF